MADVPDHRIFTGAPPLLREAARVALLAVTGPVLFLLLGFLLVPGSDVFTQLHLSNHFALTQDSPAAVIIGTAFLLVMASVTSASRLAPPHLTRSGLLLVSLLVGLGCYAGTYLIFGGYPLSMDEFLATFDAKFLREGMLVAPLPEEWRDFASALQPVFVLKAESGLAWASTYLPGNAAVRGAFSWFGDPAFTNPALAALSILLLYGVARQLEPQDRSFATLAVLLMVTSAQFLIMAMTPYAMTGHLALNLAWLWLAQRNRPWSHVLAVLVSFLATGLHQMVFHPLFVAPFLVYFWVIGRRRAALCYAVLIAACAIFWLSYWSLAIDVAALPAGTTLGLLDRIQDMMGHAIQPRSLVFTIDNFLRLLTWQNPLLLLLVFAALLALRQQPRIVYALLGGAGVTLAMLIVLMPYQGHGWGYRYLHGFLGSFALVAAYGWRTLAAGAPELVHRLRHLLMASVALSLAVLLPLRAYQAYSFTRPYARAQAAIEQSRADIVIIDPAGRYFSEDLVRNDPFLGNRPLIMRAGRIDARRLPELCGRYAVEVVTSASPQLAGLERVNGSAQEVRDRRLEKFVKAGCGIAATDLPAGPQPRPAKPAAP